MTTPGSIELEQPKWVGYIIDRYLEGIIVQIHGLVVGGPSNIVTCHQWDCGEQ